MTRPTSIVIAPRTAAVVTVGSELTEGLRVDTNTAEIARDLQRFGFRVAETVSVGDDESLLAQQFSRLCAQHALVVCTGGLGPTHDDVTRDAAAGALSRTMAPDDALVTFLERFIGRQSQPGAAELVMSQALVIEGAEVLVPENGTAAGQVCDTPGGQLLLLPGPPREMRPMLARFLRRFSAVRAEPVELGVSGMPESDVQLVAQGVLAAHAGIALTILAKPGDIRVILLDEGAGADALADAGRGIASALGDACYSSDGSSLAETLVHEAARRRITLATAESCTGGMVASAITDVPGASEVFTGGVVAYANTAKTGLLGVSPSILERFGAVSEETARAMAEGARERLGADIAVSTTGIAGPAGGTADKPVGLVWFALATASDTHAEKRVMTGASRDAIRARSTSTALELLRKAVLRA